jgi:hypothetical protein
MSLALENLGIWDKEFIPANQPIWDKEFIPANQPIWDKESTR